MYKQVSLVFPWQKKTAQGAQAGGMSSTDASTLPGTSPHCQAEMTPGWARTIRNKNTVHFHWLLGIFFASMQTKLFSSKFSPDRHTLYVGGMTGEPVWSCSTCFSSSGSWSPPQDQATLQEAYQTNTTDYPTGLTVAHSPKVIVFRLHKAHPLLHEVLSGLCFSTALPLPSLVTLAGRAGGPSSSV